MASELFSKANCTYCQEEIIGVRIKCAECQDMDLCLQCFSAGAEIGGHKNDHAYQFVDSDALDLFKSKGGWSAKEEFLLLSGIERYGFGNWEDISLLFNSDNGTRSERSPDECREEYLATFVDGAIGRQTWPWAMQRRSKLTEVTKSLLEDREANKGLKFPPVDITLEQAIQLGYMPRTDHFEKEYENDTETLISNLNITSAEDDELDVALKLAQVDMYCQKLRERMRRKRVARDYQLVSKFFNSMSLKQKVVTEQHEIAENLKFLTQFLTETEFESLVASWSRQLSLRKRAAELARYRSSGLTRFEEIPHFEQEAVSRDRPPPSTMLESVCGGSITGAADSCAKWVSASTPVNVVPPSPSALSSIPSSPADKKKRKKMRRRIRFHRAKQHAPHRAPHLIAAARAAARAAGLIR